MPIRMVLSDFAGFTLLKVADVIGLRSVLAERVGFEPTVLVKVHTLSKRAP